MTILEKLGQGCEPVLAWPYSSFFLLIAIVIMRQAITRAPRNRQPVPETAQDSERKRSSRSSWPPSPRWARLRVRASA